MIQGTEWLSLKVHGQSFMLHQIRKMVGLIIMIVRTDTPLKLIPETFKENRINIPKAPSLGLLLERVSLLCFVWLSGCLYIPPVNGGVGLPNGHGHCIN